MSEQRQIGLTKWEAVGLLECIDSADNELRADHDRILPIVQRIGKIWPDVLTNFHAPYYSSHPTRGVPMPMSIPEVWAARIYDILVAEAGAVNDQHGHNKDAFVFHMGRACMEYRFGGVLGFGGKFYNESYRTPPWSVRCYLEDENPERVEIMRRTNERLAALYQEYVQSRESSNG